jgi:hypothetical protein
MPVFPIDITQMCNLSKLDRVKITVIIDVGFEVQTVVVMKLEIFNDYVADL